MQLGRINLGLADRLEKNMDSMPVHTIPMAMKQVGELKALLEGQATACVEHTVQPRQVSNYEEYERIIAGYQKKARARIVQEGQETRLAGGKPAALALDPPAPAPDP
jgi:hypothetical protein